MSAGTQRIGPENPHRGRPARAAGIRAHLIRHPSTAENLLRQRHISEKTEMDDCLMIGADSEEGIIALDGSSGRMYSWRNNEKLLINSTLGNFSPP